MKTCPNQQCGAVWTNEILELSSSAANEEGEFIPTVSLSDAGRNCGGMLVEVRH